MIMDRGIAAAGERDEGALPGLRSGLLNRRSFLIGSAVSLGALGLAGCASEYMSLAEAEKVYGPMPDEKFPIPAVDVSKINPKYFRKTVRYDSKEAPGTIIIDPGLVFVPSKAQRKPSMTPAIGLIALKVLQGSAKKLLG